MAVSLDTSASLANPGASTTISVPITVANNANRVLVAAVMNDQFVAATGVTGGGGAAWQFLGTNAQGLEFWYSIGPSTGAQTVVATYASSLPTLAGSVTVWSLYGADQSTPLDHYTEQETVDIQTLTVTTETGDFVLVAARFNVSPDPITVGTADSAADGNNYFRAAHNTGSTTATCTWTGASGGRGLVGCNVNAVAVPAVAQSTFRFFAGSGALPTPLVSPLIEAADCTESGNNTATTSWAVSRPSQVSGDLIIMHLCSDSNVTHGTLPGGPNGETAVVINTQALGDTGTANQRISVWYWKATGTNASGTVTVTPSATEQWTGCAVKVPTGEYNATTPIDSSDNAVNSGDVSNITSPDWTCTAASGRVCVWFGVDTDPISTAPAGWTNRANTDRGAVAAAFATRDALTTASEAIAAGTWTIAGDSYCSIGYVVNALPAAGRAPIAAAGADIELEVTTDYGWQVRVQNTGGVTTEDTYKLQYKLNAGSWTDVTSSSSVVKASATADYANGADVVEYIGGAGTYVTNNNAALDTTGTLVLAAVLGAGQSFEAHLNFQIVAADVADTDTIQLRVVYEDGTVLEAYTDTPTITVNEEGGGFTLDVTNAIVISYTAETPKAHISINLSNVTHTYTANDVEARSSIGPVPASHAYISYVPETVVGAMATPTVTHDYVVESAQLSSGISVPEISYVYTSIDPKVNASVMPTPADAVYVSYAPKASVIVDAPMRAHVYTARSVLMSGSSNIPPAEQVYTMRTAAMQIVRTYDETIHTYSPLGVKVNASVMPPSRSHTYSALTVGSGTTVQASLFTHVYAAISPEARASISPGGVLHSYSGVLPSVLVGNAIPIPTTTHVYTCIAPESRASIAVDAAQHSYVSFAPDTGTIIRAIHADHNYTGQIAGVFGGTIITSPTVTHVYTSAAPLFGGIPVYIMPGHPLGRGRL